MKENEIQRNRLLTTMPFSYAAVVATNAHRYTRLTGTGSPTAVLDLTRAVHMDEHRVHFRTVLQK